RVLEQASAEWEHAGRSRSFLWEEDRVSAALSPTQEHSYTVFIPTLTAKKTATPPPVASVRCGDNARWLASEWSLVPLCGHFFRPASATSSAADDY
ncbi:MAG: hypothetical protein QOD59_2135, partial [Mycobacterium sp.]|nr:hypothetical protein [Mycobacterium sp.]